MNDAKINDAAGLFELTALEVGVVVGGVGAEPTWPKLTLQTTIPEIGEQPPRPK